MKVDINTQNRLKTARIKMSKTCPSHKANKTWPMVRLGELGTMVRGNGIRRCETVESGCPCLRYGEIYTSFNVILDKPRSFVPKELFDRSVKIKKGDLVFTLTGENTEEIAKALAYLGEGEIAAGGDLAVWTGHGCDSKYLAYLMYSPQLISQKAATGNGNIVVHTSIKKLQQLEIPLPPHPVQREIVARLERELAAVEKMKNGFEALAETAQAEFEAERLEAHKGLLDGDWPCEPLKKHVDVLAGYAFKSQGFVDSGIRICGGLIIAPDRIKWEECKYWNSSNGIEQYLLQENDLVIALDRPWISGGFKIGVIGKRDLPCLLIQRTARLRMKDVDFRYVMMLLRDESFKLHCTTSGTTVPHISHKDIETYEIPFPPAKVQKEIVARLSAAKTRAEKLEAKAREGVAVCETMRKAILKEAFE